MQPFIPRALAMPGAAGIALPTTSISPNKQAEREPPGPWLKVSHSTAPTARSEEGVAIAHPFTGEQSGKLAGYCPDFQPVQVFKLIQSRGFFKRHRCFICDGWSQ
jgi:hypothetical protein